VVDQGDCSLGILKTYEMMKLARSRTTARLMTLSGQAATVEVHGTSKRPVRLQLLPTALGEDKLHLQVAVETEGHGATADRQAAAGEAPSLTATTIDLEVDIEPGQTLLIGQPAANTAIQASHRQDHGMDSAVHQSAGGRGTETVILITPVLAGRDGAATAAGCESHRRR